MEKDKYSSTEYLDKIDKWWRAANYLSIGQLYLKDNPLLKREIRSEDVKYHPIGHWGTIAGQNFIYAHLNRIINKYDLNMFYIEGPGHGGQVMVSNSYLDGSYTEIYPAVTEDEAGMQKLFKRFSFPGGVSSHAAPETPGSIHEGGELGYSLSHGVGAILDNPEVISAVVIGDGESETGPLATSWFSNTFINPVTDGAVLPILHLNGAKIANPTILGRKSDKELEQYFRGMGWIPYFVEGNDPNQMHPLMAKTLDQVIEKIHSIQETARKQTAETASIQKWPLIVLRTPKGWTGPKEWDGKPIEVTFRAHQVPIPIDQDHMEHVDQLVNWLKSYKPEELFDETGRLNSEIRAIAPMNDKRMAMNPITNGGINPKPLQMPDWREFALHISKPGELVAQDMLEFGKMVAAIIKKNPQNFLIFGPDETKSNLLNDAFSVTSRQWLEPIYEPQDEWLAPSGRIIDSQLSEHQDEGILEGYVLTGRHGFFASYEAFIRIVDSMIAQHIKWMRKAMDLPWRNGYSSLNLIASSTAFQQDHNGYTHQDPGILSHLAEKEADFIHEYVPADTNSLLAVMDKVLKSQGKVNLVISSKHPRPQFYSPEEAQELVNRGLMEIDWASTVAENGTPEIVIVAAGTEPNMEALAAINLINQSFPKLQFRFINVVDLLKLRHPAVDSRGISEVEYNHLFTVDSPIIFVCQGYSSLIRSLFYDRKNRPVSIHSYQENGAITTPFDMRVLNKIDRYHLAKDIALTAYGSRGEDFARAMDTILEKHNQYIRETGKDLPEVLNWKWAPLHIYNENIEQD